MDAATGFARSHHPNGRQLIQLRSGRKRIREWLRHMTRTDVQTAGMTDRANCRQSAGIDLGHFGLVQSATIDALSESEAVVRCSGKVLPAPHLPVNAVQLFNASSALDECVASRIAEQT